MVKGWHNDRQRHRLASMGIRTGMNARGMNTVDDLSKLLILQEVSVYNLPYNREIASENVNKYKKTGYTYVIGSDRKYAMVNVSPTFETVGELDDWWDEHKTEIKDILDNVIKINNEECGDEDCEFWIKSYTDIDENKLVNYDEPYPSNTYFGNMLTEEIYDYLSKFNKKNIYVNVYEADKGYGGAEEGGWWYDIQNPVLTVRVKNKEDAREWYEKLSKVYPRTGKRSNVGGGEDYDVDIEGYVGEYSPQERPIYY